MAICKQQAVAFSSTGGFQSLSSHSAWKPCVFGAPASVLVSPLTCYRRCRPLLKLCDRLLLIGYVRDEDIADILVMIDHASWDPSFDPEGKDEHRRVAMFGLPVGCVSELVMRARGRAVRRARHQRNLHQNKSFFRQCVRVEFFCPSRVPSVPGCAPEHVKISSQRFLLCRSEHKMCCRHYHIITTCYRKDGSNHHYPHFPMLYVYEKLM